MSPFLSFPFQFAVDDSPETEHLLRKIHDEIVVDEVLWDRIPDHMFPPGSLFPPDFLFWESDAVPVTRAPAQWTLVVREMIPDKYIAYNFNKLEDLPLKSRDAVHTLLFELTHLALSDGKYTVLKKESNPIESYEQGIPSLIELISSQEDRVSLLQTQLLFEQDSERRDSLSSEIEGLQTNINLNLKPSLARGKTTLAELRAYLSKYGEWSPGEREMIRSYIKYQESICLESDGQEVEVGFNCQAIRIRDFLKYGPSGVPADELERRKSRPLPDKPPPLPFPSSNAAAPSTQPPAK